MRPLLTLGVDATTGDVIVDPIDPTAAAKTIAAGPGDPAWGRRGLVPPRLGVVEGGDPYDPREVGWVVVVGKDDPAASAIETALAGLAGHRTEDGFDWGPLTFARGADPESWILDNLWSRDPVPRYVVLAGSPTYLPFSLQATLSTGWLVGRLDFSTVTGGVEAQDVVAMRQYADRMGDAAAAAPAERVLVWAPNAGRRDATFYSRHLLAERVAASVEAKRKFAVGRIFDGAATSAVLLEQVAEQRPLLLFTASHGAAAKLDEKVDRQAAINGALVGQDGVRLTAASLPAPSEPFVEGGVVFQFACFGYGTPATSGYSHWDSQIKRYEAPFELVSALPKAALAHPRGPVGYIAHADYALLHAFANTARLGREPPKRAAGRTGSFRSVVNDILLGRPLGAALSPMAAQLGLLNHDLNERWDRAQHDGVGPIRAADLVDRFLRRNDARYYFLLGDPAARPTTTRT